MLPILKKLVLAAPMQAIGLLWMQDSTRKDVHKFLFDA